MKFIENENQLTLEYKGQVIFQHNNDNPFLYVGTGREEVDSYRGNYKIIDNVDTRIPLKEFRLNGEYEVIFSLIGLELKLTVEEIDNRLHFAFECNDESINRFWLRLHADPEEKVYGCGEQASYFNLRGRNFPLWTSEPGVGRDKSTLTTFYADKYDKAGGDYYNTYYPEQTFVSTRKYWLHVDSFAYADFNFKNDTFHELHIWEVPKTMVMEFADSYLDIVNRMTDYIGRPPMLPEWLLDGVVLGVQGGTDEVLRYLEESEEKGINVNGLWCQDWAGINITSFGKRLYWNWMWNEERYPRLVEVIKELNEKDVKFLTYICPFLLENESLFNYAKQHDFLAKTVDGDTYKEDFGEFYCGIVDLTNEDAFNWYKDIIKTNIIDLGISGWMADFGEYLPTDCVLKNGKGMDKHNEWPVLWAKCNYEAVKESGKLGEVFYFMRAAAYGSQKYSTSMWCGDQSVNWETHDGIASVIPSMLSTGIIGNPYTHSDIGGYTSLHGNVRTKELFDRWLEMNTFTSYMRTHEGNRPSENFQFYNNDDTMDLMAVFSNIRTALMPYITELNKQGSESGYPMHRPLFMHYEQDQRAYDEQYEYLFGADMLVAPVVEPGVTVKDVYLPEDEWVHLWTGKEYKGGDHKVAAPVGYPAVFYRKNSEFSGLFEEIGSLNSLK